MQNSRVTLRDVVSHLYDRGGYAEQAEAAMEAGTLPSFFAKLLTILGPVIGTVIQALLMQFLGLPKTTGKRVNESSVEIKDESSLEDVVVSLNELLKPHKLHFSIDEDADAAVDEPHKVFLVVGK